MIKFFGKMQYGSTKKYKLVKYLKHAIGEIVFIVIGVLIALQVNIWNEHRKEKNKLKDIYSRIILDIDNNILEATTILQFYEGRKYLYERVMRDSITSDLFKDKLDYLITGSYIYDMDRTGIDQLKIFNTRDSIAIKAIRLFDTASSTIKLIEAELIADNKNTLKDWRDKYSWFPEFLRNELNEEAKAYFLTSQDYRNKVSYHYILVYSGHIPTLKGFIDELKTIKEILQTRINNKTTTT